MSQRASRGAVASALLFGIGAAWNGGNVGPAVHDLSADFDLSLATIGLLSGTAFFAAVIVAVLLANELVERAGLPDALRLTCLLCGIGNLIFAFSPAFGGLAAGRVIAGLGTGLAFVLAPIFARSLGGVRLVGAVGASMQLGLAGALAIGSVFYDSGIDHRYSFLISAAIGFSALPLLPRDVPGGTAPTHPRRLLRIEFSDPDVWRLTALFVGTLTVPLILSAWMIYFLVDAGLAAGVAGALSFVLFAFSASMRFAGGRLSAAGVSPRVLAGLTPLLAAVGLVLLARDQSLGVVLIASLLTGAGFALPFAVLMTESQWILPADPVAPVALMSLVNNAIPIVAIPVAGSAFNQGNGETVLIILAATVAVGSLLNLSPPRRQIDPPAEPEGQRNALPSPR